MADIVRPVTESRTCLTRGIEEVTSLPGSPCRVRITKQVLLKDPRRTVCTPCRDKLINANYRMAIWTAYRVWSKYPIYYKRMDRDEAAACGLLALVTCAGRYNPKKGKLGTILAWYVRSELQNQTVHHGGAVTLPLHTSRRDPDSYFKYQEQLEAAMRDPHSVDHAQRHGRLPAAARLAEASCTPEEEEAHPRMSEILAVAGWGSDNTPRERKAFLDSVLHGKTLAEIGEEHGFSKEAARQMKNRALRNIKETLKDKGITA